MSSAATAEQVSRAVSGRESLPYLDCGAEPYGFALLAAGRALEALPLFEFDVDFRERKLGEKSDTLLPSLFGLGLTHLLLGHPKRAVPLLERAMALHEGDVELRMVKGVPFALARALWEAREDRRRARELALQSRAQLEALGFKEDVAEIDAWLRHHLS